MNVALNRNVSINRLKLLTRACQVISNKRHKSYLSEEFKCQGAWAEQYTNPLFGRIELSKYFFDIDRKFQNEGRGSPVDVDIFSSASYIDITNMSAEAKLERLEQLEELLRRFRRTPQTSLMMPATHHAVVRAFISADQTDSLMRILNNRVDFGVFPDNYTFTFLLHHFLSHNNFRDSARTAVAMMLQEEYKIPIASEMGLFGTYIYTKSLKDQTEPWDPQPPLIEEEPEDEVKIRVEYLENNYFDDHFDLTSRDHLLGKTLAKFSAHSLTENSSDEKVAKDSLELVGWTLFQKWDKVGQICQKLKGATVAQECVQLIQSHLAETTSDNEDQTKALDLVASLPTTDSLNVESFLESRIIDSVLKNESIYIEDQKKTFKQSTIDRETELDKQYKLFLRESKLKEMQEVSRQLTEKEEQLFFFDNYEKMEKKKFEKFAEWRRTWPRRTFAPQIKMSHLENVDPYKK